MDKQKVARALLKVAQDLLDWNKYGKYEAALSEAEYSLADIRKAVLRAEGRVDDMMEIYEDAVESEVDTRSINPRAFRTIRRNLSEILKAVDKAEKDLEAL